MLAHLVLAAVLLFAGKDPAVVGTWGMGGATVLWINADGTGEMEGQAFKWSTDKGVFSIVASDGETDEIGYAVKGGKLVISMDGVPLALDKMGAGGTPVEAAAPAKGKTGKAAAVPPGMEGLSPEEIAMLQQMREAKAQGQPAGAPAKAPKAAAPAKAGKDELSQFLLRNAWCTFTFNKHSGASSKSRSQFFPDGTFTTDGQSEGYSSGYGGTMASQQNSGSSGQWRVVKGQLEFNTPATNGQWVGAPFEVTRNSNGSPIIKGGGKEYMVCE